MVPSSLFILASSVYKSLQCLISTLTQGGEGGHLFRLTCLAVLWGGRNTANKYHWLVWGVLAVYGPHWVCPSSWQVCFPGLHCSGFRLFCRGTVQSRPWVSCTSQVQATRFRFSVLHKGTDSIGRAFFALPRSEQLRPPGACRVHCSR